MKAIILFRNTPRSPSGFSPNELLFGRQLRDILPADCGHYLPQHRQAIEARFDELRRRQPQPGTSLSILKPGQESAGGRGGAGQSLGGARPAASPASRQPAGEGKKLKPLVSISYSVLPSA